MRNYRKGLAGEKSCKGVWGPEQRLKTIDLPLDRYQYLKIMFSKFSLEIIYKEKYIILKNITQWTSTNFCTETLYRTSDI